jgi:3-hydroxyacyl-CoA dehydrogenase
LSIVRIEREGDCALVIINNPPVNALGYNLRVALLDAIKTIDQSDARSGLLICEGKTFIAGADIKEFGKPLVPPILPHITRALEDSLKIWAAAVHGNCLGGGIELVLGCDARIALKGTEFGFPEVNIGIIPGAGGTQRAPRLIGIDAALELASSGKRIGAEQALALHLIDKIAVHDLRAEALDYLKTIKTKRTLPQAPVRVSDTTAYEEKLIAIDKKARGQIAPLEAARAVLLATSLPLDEGLREERAIFERLNQGVQARALRYLFFAEREVAKIPGLENAASVPLKKIGVVGGGTMGCGIAAASLLAGFETVLVEKDLETLAKARMRLDEILKESKKRGHAFPEDKLSFLSDLKSVSSCDLVIEAVFEDLTVKKTVISQIGKILKSGGVIATNTSYLDVNELAQASNRPEHFLGLHFFAPAHIMKLLEIVRGKKTVPEALAVGFAFSKALKKIGVLAGASEGFIGNRIWQAYRREIEFMLEDGASPYDIDSAMEEIGFVLGPFKVADLSGLDIAWAQRKRSAATRSTGERYVEIPDLLCEKGRLGRKTSAGWYAYENGRPTSDPVVSNIIESERKRKNISPRYFSAEDIRERVFAVIVNEGAKLLEEKVALRPLDIDVVMVNGYGYPRWRGGPLFEADEAGLSAVLTTLKRAIAQNGGSAPSALFEKFVSKNSHFRDLNKSA